MKIILKDQTTFGVANISTNISANEDVERFMITVRNDKNTLQISELKDAFSQDNTESITLVKNDESTKVYENYILENISNNIDDVWGDNIIINLKK